MGDLLDGYRLEAGWDEMLETSHQPRAHYRTLFEQIQTLSRADFDERCSMRDRVFSDLVPGAVLDNEPHARETLQRLEEKVSRLPAYQAMATRLHLLARRPEADRT